MPKLIIPPARALLILLNAPRGNVEHTTYLNKLYLCGIEITDALYLKQLRELKALFADPTMSQYQITYDPKAINSDPTRRYFETHLAYETLKSGLKHIDTKELEALFSALKSSLHHSIYAIFSNELQGIYNQNSDEEDDGLSNEYCDYILKIKTNKLFQDFPEADRNKIILLVQCTFLSVLNGKLNNDLPLDIYGAGVFSDKYRGKILVSAQESTRNQHLGIMKGHMPLAADDIARSPSVFPFLKPSDQSDFDELSPWAIENFTKLVHPYSNSNSGTILCQLRCLLYLHQNGQGYFTNSADQLALYLKLVIAVMLFNSGGHSLYEYTAPIRLIESQKAFSPIVEFGKISLESMFLTQNQSAFNQALKDTIHYHLILEKRAKMHEELTSLVALKGLSFLRNEKATVGAGDGNRTHAISLGS